MATSRAFGKSSRGNSAYGGLLAAGAVAAVVWIAAAAFVASHERDRQIAAELAAETRQIEQAGAGQ